MKKMLVGIILLIILFFTALINSIYLENTLVSVQNKVKESYHLSYSKSIKCLEDGLAKWKSASKYTNSILSDNACEKVTTAFYQCLSEPKDLIIRDKLIHELSELIEAESLSFTSIF